jgi:hypothetical protein
MSACFMDGTHTARTRRARRPSPIGGDAVGVNNVLVGQMGGHVLARILASHPHFCDWGAQQLVLCVCGSIGQSPGHV